MALTPIPIERFGGLLLSGDPEEARAAARDMKNARLDRPGQLVTRGGFDTLNSATQSNVAGFYWGRSTGASVNRYFTIETTGNGVVRIYAAGLASHTDYSAPTNFANSTFSGSALEFGGYMLFARTNTTLLKVINVTFSGTVGSPQAYFLTLSGTENRVVAAYAQIGGTPVSSRVHFSAPGDPTSWGTTDYVDIWPEDGQPIRAAVTYRDQVFVFKDRRFVVFTEESVDADGGSIFNYRPVDVGIGCAYNFGATVGPDGVYFLAADGIYRTQGDMPVLISGPLQALFDGATGSDWSGPTSIVTPRLFATQDRMYFINDSKVFYYHFATGTWAFDVYAPGVQFIAQTPTQKPRSVYFIDGTGKACEAGDSFTDDDGTAIAWSYKTGRYSLADAGHVAVIPETSLVGSGTVTLRLDSDLYTNQSGSATLGTAPAVAEGWPSGVDQEGTWVQSTLSGSGAAVVNSIVHHVSSVKPAGVR